MTKIASFTAEQNAEQEARSGKVMPYTPAPWKVRKLIHGSWDQWDITAEIAGGMRVAIAATPGGNGNDSSNARRIVACVNACEGMSTERLEADLPILAERDALKARERELVEALSEAASWELNLLREENQHRLVGKLPAVPWLEKARAILARVKP